MIYALNGQGVPRPIRRTIAQAILDEDDDVLDWCVNNDTIVHVETDPDPHGLFCIYCLDTLEVVHAVSLFYRHSDTAGCVGSVQHLGILNPPGHGA